MAFNLNVISTQQVNTFETGPQTLVGSTALRGGGYVVLWETFTEDGFGRETRGQVYTSAGEPLGENFSITERNVLSVTQNDDGGFVIQYSESEAQNFSPDGVAGEAISLDPGDWRNRDDVFRLENGNLLTIALETRQLPFEESASFLVGDITTTDGRVLAIEELQVTNSVEIVPQADGGFWVLATNTDPDFVETAVAFFQSYGPDGLKEGETRVHQGG